MDPSRFRWVVVDDRENSVFAFVRSAPDGSIILTVSNFTPVPRLNYTLSVESDGLWQELLNTDAAVYGGSNVGNGGLVFARRNSSTSNNSLLTLVLPPLSTLMLRNARQ
jgi:1,4-alpha-glucan branching enzyme